MAGFNSSLGLVRDPSGEGLVLETRPEHEAFPGVVHFAVLAAIAEIAAAEAVGASVAPTNVSVQLMKRATTGRLVARGRLLRRGRSLAFAAGEVYQEDRLVAKAGVTFAVLQ
jgi:acyl-coenzyme A thioesterase PaaI-like protein